MKTLFEHDELRAGLVKGRALGEYFKQHAEPIDRARFFRVTKPLPAFKSAYSGGSFALVNLTIPVGALVYVRGMAFVTERSHASEQRKMRASAAIVHSIWRFGRVYDHINKTNIRAYEEVQFARSRHDPHFTYRPGERVVPCNSFSMDWDACASGIHFFLNVRDALYW